MVHVISNLLRSNADEDHASARVVVAMRQVSGESDELHSVTENERSGAVVSWGRDSSSSSDGGGGGGAGGGGGVRSPPPPEANEEMRDAGGRVTA